MKIIKTAVLCEELGELIEQYTVEDNGQYSLNDFGDVYFYESMEELEADTNKVIGIPYNKVEYFMVYYNNGIYEVRDNRYRLFDYYDSLKVLIKEIENGWYPKIRFDY